MALPQQQNRSSDSAALWICDAGDILLKGYEFVEKSVKAFWWGELRNTTEH